MSWRLKQLRMLGIDSIDQDQQLIDYVNSNSIPTVVIWGSNDIEYFQSHLPQATVTSMQNPFPGCLMCFFIGHTTKFETVLAMISDKVADFLPNYVYVAINKYIITTEHAWPNLTNDYDQDLLNILTATMFTQGYKEVQRSFIADDRGQYFNFAHGTTNAYYEII